MMELLGKFSTSLLLLNNFSYKLSSLKNKDENLRKCKIIYKEEMVISNDMHILGRASKKNVKFGLLAEIRQGRGLRGVHEPNLLSGIFFIV